MLILTDFYNMGACAMKQINKNVKHHLNIFSVKSGERTNDESKQKILRIKIYVRKLRRKNYVNRKFLQHTKKGLYLGKHDNFFLRFQRTYYAFDELLLKSVYKILIRRISKKKNILTRDIRIPGLIQAFLQAISDN